VSGERPSFERRDIRPGSVLRGGILIAALTAASAGGAYLVFRALQGGGPDTTVAQPPSPPAPRLQTNEHADLAAVVAAQRRQLDSYGWIDRKAGVVHIPVRQAMKEILAQGFPVREQVVIDEGAPVPTDSGGIR
jgi:hypothetical protein